MLTSTIDSIREDNARFAREVEYIRETALDDVIDQRIEVAERQFDNETIEELEEAVDMVKRLSNDEDVVEEAAEIEKILNAEGDITFNEMVGIE